MEKESRLVAPGTKGSDCQWVLGFTFGDENVLELVMMDSQVYDFA